MNVANKTTVLLLVIIGLLVWSLAVQSRSHPAAFVPFVSELSAQTSELTGDLLFYPVGNQEVRKFVFWDREANTVYIYRDNGRFEEAWRIGPMGEDMKKQ
jgi:hypothetical protein